MSAHLEPVAARDYRVATARAMLRHAEATRSVAEGMPAGMLRRYYLTEANDRFARALAARNPERRIYG